MSCSESSTRQTACRQWMMIWDRTLTDGLITWLAHWNAIKRHWSRSQLFKVASLRGRQIKCRPAWFKLRPGAFTCVWRQVTLCDPMWQVTLRSSAIQARTQTVWKGGSFSLPFGPFLPLPFPFLPFPPLLSLRSIRPLKSSYGVWGSAVSSPSGVWGGAPAEIEFCFLKVAIVGGDACVCPPSKIFAL